MKIVKSFDPQLTERDIDSTGTFSQLSWKSLQPYLEQIFRIDKDRTICGIIADDFGITVHIDSK